MSNIQCGILIECLCKYMRWLNFNILICFKNKELFFLLIGLVGEEGGEDLSVICVLRSSDETTSLGALTQD